VPSGRAIRRFTAATTNTRAGAGMGDLLGDVYYVVVIAAIGLAMALGVAGTLREALPSTDTAAAPVWDVPGLSLAALVAAILVGYAGVVLSLAGRLGPVSAGGPEAAWWLPLPVERRGLLRPAQWRVPAVAALASGVLVGILDAGLLGAPDGGRVARTVVGSALAAALVVLTAALGQTFDASRRATALAGEVVLLAAPLVALGGALLGWRLAELPPVPPVALGALAVLAVGVGLVVDRRLGRIPARTLRAGGAVASQAVGAMVSLDTRELGRALGEGSARPRRRRSLRMGLVRGPASALVTADALVLTRSVRHLVQLAVTALVPALVATAPQLAGPVGFALALVVGGYVAMTSSAEGARRAEMAPVLDRLLPLAAREVRLLRMVVPGVAMALWSLVAFGVVGLWSGDPATRRRGSRSGSRRARCGRVLRCARRTVRRPTGGHRSCRPRWARCPRASRACSRAGRTSSRSGWCRSWCACSSGGSRPRCSSCRWC
jgi:hypothetical protein